MSSPKKLVQVTLPTMLGKLPPSPTEAVAAHLEALSLGGAGPSNPKPKPRVAEYKWCAEGVECVRFEELGCPAEKSHGPRGTIERVCCGACKKAKDKYKDFVYTIRRRCRMGDQCLDFGRQFEGQPGDATCGPPATNKKDACKKCVKALALPEFATYVQKVDTTCKEPGCKCTVDNKKKYEGYCLVHAADHGIPTARRALERERMVLAAVDAVCPGGVRQLIMDGKRPDWLKVTPKLVLIVEVDEKQHKGKKYLLYDGTRTWVISKHVAKTYKLPLVILRFNPDGFRDSNNVRHEPPLCTPEDHQPIYVKDKCRDEWDWRIKVLQTAVLHFTNESFTPVKALTEEKLFFDGHDDTAVALAYSL